MRIAHKSLSNVATFKYFRTTTTTKNGSTIHEGMKIRLNAHTSFFSEVNTSNVEDYSEAPRFKTHSVYNFVLFCWHESCRLAVVEKRIRGNFENMMRRRMRGSERQQVAPI
jgi:hypothetical protein